MSQDGFRREHRLNATGERIVARGGHDDASDDDMLLMEIMKRAPGCTKEEYQTFFVSLRMECGEDALYALQNGHVTFEGTE